MRIAHGLTGSGVAVVQVGTWSLIGQQQKKQKFSVLTNDGRKDKGQLMKSVRTYLR